MDGNGNSDFGGGSCSPTLVNSHVWWMVDLGEDFTVTNVIITSRNQGSKYVDVLSVDIQEEIYLSLQTF